MGSSEQIGRVLEQVKLVAPTGFSVLITGETGSGKELIAKAIHRVHSQQAQPFIAVDCGSIPASLIESELFGHEKGSFTGAHRSQQGKFEAASGGTLFLDEISNLPLPVQPKLLRALQEKQICRVGGTHPVAIKTRVVAASNQILPRLVQAKAFRRDLYHRLNEFSLAVPALRERPEDIVHLAKRFINLTNEELKKNVKGLSDAALKVLLSYKWPGNVRELRNVIRRAVLMADTHIRPEHLSILDVHRAIESQSLNCGDKLDGSVGLKEIVNRVVMQVERKILLQVLTQTHGNKAKAARLLHIDYKTIHNKVREYDISSPRRPHGHGQE